MKSLMKALSLIITLMLGVPLQAQQNHYVTDKSWGGEEGKIEFLIDEEVYRHFIIKTLYLERFGEFYLLKVESDPDQSLDQQGYVLVKLSRKYSDSKKDIHAVAQKSDGKPHWDTLKEFYGFTCVSMRKWNYAELFWLPEDSPFAEPSRAEMEVNIEYWAQLLVKYEEEGDPRYLAWKQKVLEEKASKASAEAEGSWVASAEANTEIDKAEPPAHESTKSEAGIVEVSDFRLAIDYKNEVAGDQKYKGKILAVEGEVKSVGRDMVDGLPYVQLEGAGLANYVFCVFNRGLDQVGGLEIGQSVRLSGRCIGKSAGNFSLLGITLTDCKVLR